MELHRVGISKIWMCPKCKVGYVESLK
jgi:hypothetical protein